MINIKDLNQFTGTENYHRFSAISRSVLTDGAKYVAEQGNFWLFDAVDSHLITKRQHLKDYLAVAKFNGKELRIENGDGKLVAKQEISNDQIKGDIFAQFDGSRWVYLLPSEY